MFEQNECSKFSEPHSSLQYQHGLHSSSQRDQHVEKINFLQCATKHPLEILLRDTCSFLLSQETLNWSRDCQTKPLLSIPPPHQQHTDSLVSTYWNGGSRHEGAPSHELWGADLCPSTPVFLTGTTFCQAETRYFHLPNKVPVHEHLLCSYMNFM